MLLSREYNLSKIEIFNAGSLLYIYFGLNSKVHNDSSSVKGLEFILREHFVGFSIQTRTSRSSDGFQNKQSWKLFFILPFIFFIGNKEKGDCAVQAEKKNERCLRVKINLSSKISIFNIKYIHILLFICLVRLENCFPYPSAFVEQMFAHHQNWGVDLNMFKGNIKYGRKKSLKFFQHLVG